MCGRSFSFNASADYDVYVVKTNDQGILQWSKTYGLSGTASATDIGYSIQQTRDGGYIITGETYSFGVGFKNLYLIKTDSLGNSGCNEGIPATVTSVFTPQVISPPVLTSSGGVISYPATLVNAGGNLTTICLITGIEVPETDFNVSIYPNPLTSSTNLEFYLSEINNVSLIVYDIVGREIKNIPAQNFQSGNNSISIDLSGAKQGIYFCRLKANEKVQTYKLLKQN